jgi:preprotein translocase subunit SecE
MKRKRTIHDWISLLLFLAVAAGIVWILAHSGPVAAIWPAAK